MNRGFFSLSKTFEAELSLSRTWKAGFDLNFEGASLFANSFKAVSNKISHSGHSIHRYGNKNSFDDNEHFQTKT